MNSDPFLEFRASQPSFDSVTHADGRGQTLTGIDLALFHEVAHAVVALANRCGWHVTELRHRVPGANVERLTVTPHR